MSTATGGQPLYHDPTLTPGEPTPPGPSTMRKIFLGPDGLRAGWGLLIFIALFAVIALIVNVIGHKLYPHDREAAASAISPLMAFAIEGINFLAVLFITWIMSKIERRAVAVYGLGDSRKLAHFFAGLGWGLACLSLLIVTLLKTGFLVIDSRVLFGGNILRYGAIWLFMFLLVSLFEEYITRGYVQYTLTRGLASVYQWAFKSRHSTDLAFWTSALIFSALFGFSHQNNPNESPIGMLSAGLGGMVFCFSLWRTGSLWWAIGFHTSWDWSQSFLYGVADSGLSIQHHLFATHPVGKPVLSGGATGPEGSIFILAILAVIIAIVVATIPRTRYGQAAKAFE
jgi:membrane protease YdiL (CAAX protease family)